MTLNRSQTDFFLSGCFFQNETGDVSDLWKFLHDATAIITDTDYSGLQALWDTWESNYNSGSLYGTHPDSTTYKITDISKLPHRPNR